MVIVQLPISFPLYTFDILARVTFQFCFFSALERRQLRSDESPVSAFVFLRASLWPNFTRVSRGRLVHLKLHALCCFLQLCVHTVSILLVTRPLHPSHVELRFLLSLYARAGTNFNERWIQAPSYWEPVPAESQMLAHYRQVWASRRGPTADCGQYSQVR